MPPGWAMDTEMSKPPSLLRRASTSSALFNTGTMSAGTRPGPPSASSCLRSSAQKPVSTVSGRRRVPSSSVNQLSARYWRYGRPLWVKKTCCRKCSESSSPLPSRPRPSHSPMSHERGTSSGVRSVGISMGIWCYLEIRPAPESGWLLLALEEAVDHETGEPGHGQARDAEQDKEEDF